MAKPSNVGQGTLEAGERMAQSSAALEQVFQDVRFGLWLLRRESGFAATTVLTLTLAIGATTTIFSVVDAVLLQPPPFPEPDRLVTLWQTDPNNGNRPAEPAPANFLDWRGRAASFEQMVAIEPYSFDFTGDGEPEVFYASLVTEGFFEALDGGGAYGRTFLPEEFQPGSGVSVLTHGFWQRRFGGDTGILGRSLTLDGQPYTVVGVLPPDFELGLERGRGERDLYVPWNRQAEEEARVNFFRATLQEIRALPGVAAAGAISSFPLGLADMTAETPFTIHDRPPPPLGEEPTTVISQVTPGYFETMRIPLRAGRRFDDERDDAERPGVAVLNETLARRHWPEADPLLQRLTVEVFGQPLEVEIIGVVGATRAQGLTASSAQRPSSRTRKAARAGR